jgi:hypothetical protein
MSGPASNYEESVRWQPVLNTLNEWIPPYAAMCLAGYGDVEDDTSSSLDDPNAAIPYGVYGFGSKAKEDGQAYWRVGKPTVAVWREQNPDAIWFNGSTAIPPNGWGSGTQDYPVIALHDWRRNILCPGIPCTVIPNDWALVAGGDMFNCMGHLGNGSTGGGQLVDGGSSISGDPVKPPDKPWHGIWVARGRKRTVPAWNHGHGGVASAPTLAYFTPSGTIFAGDYTDGAGYNGRGIVRYGSAVINNSQTAGVGGPSSLNGTFYYIPRTYGGVYLLSFSATAWMDQAVPRDTLLDLSIAIFYPTMINSSKVSIDEATGLPTGYESQPRQVFHVARTQQIESDQAYGINNVVAKENMAITIPTFLPDFAVITCRNYSAHTVQLMYPTLGIASLGRRDYLDPVADFETGFAGRT